MDGLLRPWQNGQPWWQGFHQQGNSDGQDRSQARQATAPAAAVAVTLGHKYSSSQRCPTCLL